MNSEKIHPYSKYTFVHDQYLEYYVYKKQVYEVQGKALKIIHKLPALGATKALYQEVTKNIVKKHNQKYRTIATFAALVGKY